MKITFHHLQWRHLCNSLVTSAWFLVRFLRLCFTLVAARDFKTTAHVLCCCFNMRNQLLCCDLGAKVTTWLHSHKVDVSEVCCIMFFCFYIYNWLFSFQILVLFERQSSPVPLSPCSRATCHMYNMWVLEQLVVTQWFLRYTSTWVSTDTRPAGSPEPTVLPVDLIIRKVIWMLPLCLSVLTAATSRHAVFVHPPPPCVAAPRANDCLHTAAKADEWNIEPVQHK